MNDATPRPDLYALLVGINEYKSPSVPRLWGCVNDVDAMAQLLTDRFGVAPANILRLADAQATHTAIKIAFEQHLIAAARKWVADGRPEPAPAFLFHFSGHGSQTRDPTGTEPDGLDETIVPHDSRVEGVYDIKDWELGALVDQLTAITDNVTVVLDACHSGSGTKAVDEDADAVRECPPDERLDQPHRPAGGGARDLTGASDWIAQGRHVLIAGCLDRQRSREMTVPEVEDGADAAKEPPAGAADGARGGGAGVAAPAVRKQGALTYYLIDTLAKMSPDQPLTYRELHARVRQLVNLRYADQTPQCEGDLDREVFGGARPLRDALLAVSAVRDGMAVVEGGLAHGLVVGTELAAFPPETRRIEGAGPPLATLVVARAGGTQTTCQIQPAGDGLLPVVPVGAKAAITRLSYGTMRCRVALVGLDPNLAGNLTERLAAPSDGANWPDLSGLLECVAPDQAPDLRVAQLADGRLVIQDPAGTPVVTPRDPGQVDLLVADLAHIARFRNGRSLRNADPNSQLAGKVEVQLYRLKLDGNGGVSLDESGQPAIEPVPERNGMLMLTALPTRPDGSVDFSHQGGDSLVFKITNRHNHDLHVTLLNYTQSWGVTQLYPPPGQQAAVTANAAGFYVGRTADLNFGTTFPVQMEAGLPEVRDLFKVIVTAKPADFTVLEQAPLNTQFETRALAKDGAASPLQTLLDQAAGSGTRAVKPHYGIASDDDWATFELQAITVRAVEHTGRALVPGAPTQLDYGLKLTVPAGFSGTARLLTPAQSSRYLGAAEPAAAGAAGLDLSLQAPPGLAGFGSWFQPLSLGSGETRGEPGTGALAEAGAVIELASDQAEAWRAVTPDAPLTLELPEPVEAGAGLLALGFDGELYYPVGWQDAGGRSVDIAWLPEPAPPGEAAEATKDLKGALRLYLFKAIGLPTPELGLRRSRFITASEIAAGDPAVVGLRPGERPVSVSGGELRYGPLRPGDIRAGERVALFVHGFISDTVWMADGLARWLESKGLHYHHVLTFDYETMHTGMDANGAALAEALRLAGFAADDGITLDVFAHSMGTQVTRSMIEIHGGHAFVDRAVLAGPPNAGTALASLKQPVVWLLTLMLNHAGPTPPAMAASWALTKFSDTIVGMNDLRPDSDFYEQLSVPGAQHDVVYRILIGRNTVRQEARGAWERAARRLADDADTLLDFIHRGENDLAIAVASARAIELSHPKATDSSRLDICEVTCDHFAYFGTPETQARVLQWLGVQ